MWNLNLISCRAVLMQVLEHVPEQFEAIVLDNLVRSAREGIVLSWAVPGQPGHHHVNLQTSESEHLILEATSFHRSFPVIVLSCLVSVTSEQML